MKSLSTLLFILLISATIVRAAGCIMAGPKDIYWRPADQTVSYFKEFPQGFNAFAVALQSEKATVTIENGVAQVEVTQKFYNTSRDTLQAYYLMPVPAGEKFDNFILKVNDAKYIVDLMPTEKTYYTWSDLVKRTDNPAYWQFAAEECYKVGIYSVLPGASIDIVMSYSQQLKPSLSGVYTYTYPCRWQGIAPQNIREFDLDIAINTPNQVKNVYSPTPQLKIETAPTGLNASIHNRNTKADKDAVISFNTSANLLGYTLQAYKEAGKEGYFLLTFDAGIGKMPQVVHKNIVFMLDASAEMPTATLSQVKKGITQCLDNLNEGDKFNIIAYADAPKSAFTALQTADATHISSAKTFLDNISAGGAANAETALRQVLATPEELEHPFMLFWINATEPTAGAKDAKALLSLVEQSSTKHRYIYPIGVTEKVNAKTLDQIALLTRGYSNYAITGEDAGKAITDLYSQVQTPIFNNMQMYYTNAFKIPVTYPNALEKLMFQSTPLVISGKYKQGGLAKISLTGNVNGDIKRFDFDIDFPETDITNPLLGKLCASREIGALLNKIRFEGDTGNSIADETFEIADKYKVISPYTVHLLAEEYQYLSAAEKEQLPEVFKSGNSYDADWEALNQVKGAAGMKAAREVQELSNMRTVNDIGIPQARMGFGSNNNEKNNSPKQQCVFIGGKTICKDNNGAWADATLQFERGAPERIAYGSEPYYMLVQQNKPLSTYLALGKKIKFAHGGKIYEIFEEQKSDKKD